MVTVYTKSYAAPEIKVREIFRYMGMRTENSDVGELIDRSIAEAKDKFIYKVCYTGLPISQSDSEIDFGFARVRSLALKKLLVDCDKIIIFVATVGIEIDRLIKKSGVFSPLQSLAYQAFGTERIEALCDAFYGDILEEKNRIEKTLTSRFSPGYADLPLELQRDIFRALECEKRIGITLNESMLMSPSKSVSAIIGVRNL